MCQRCPRPRSAKWVVANKHALQELPGAIVDDPVQDTATHHSGDGGAAVQVTGADTDDAMKIAWRYQNKPQVQVNTQIKYAC